METTTIGVYKFDIKIDTYWNEDWVIDFSTAKLRKYEVIWETPKKFRMKISTLESIWGRLEFTTIEKLYPKENVSISSKPSLEIILDYVWRYRKSISDSIYVSEYRKEYLLRAIDTIGEAEIIEYFFSGTH